MDEKQYRIIIENETDGDSTPVAGARSNNTVNTASIAKKKASGTNASGLVAVNAIKPYISQAINFGMSQIGNTTGNVELQRKAQAFSSILGTVSSIGIAAWVGGPVTAAATAAVMAVQGIVSASFRAVEISTQKRIENENIALRKSRLGMAVNHSRTGGVSK